MRVMSTTELVVLVLAVLVIGVFSGLWIDAKMSIDKMDRNTLEHVMTVSDKTCAQNGGVKLVDYQDREFTVLCNNGAVFYDLKYK